MNLLTRPIHSLVFGGMFEIHGSSSGRAGGVFVRHAKAGDGREQCAQWTLPQRYLNAGPCGWSRSRTAPSRRIGRSPKLSRSCSAHPVPVAKHGYGRVVRLPAGRPSRRPLDPARRDLERTQIVGQSCYLNIRPREAGVEIGSTWYARAAQGGIVNPTCKLLLIGNAFDQGAERVELKTDALNAHSRAAMLKMGASSKASTANTCAAPMVRCATQRGSL
jgi:hypothetical protein